MAVKAQEITGQFAIYHGDSCEVLPSLPDNSVGLSVYSPPFAELYNYSSDDRDLSNCKDYEEFLVHYEFIVKEMARLTAPGRLTCVHCMDLMKSASSYRDFPGDIIRLHEKHGFHFQTRFMAWKEPLGVRNKTYLQSLMHKQVCEDSSIVTMANPDFVVVMRRAGKNENPIEHPEGLQEFAGTIDPKEREKLGLAPVPGHYLACKGKDLPPRENKWSHWIWQRYASSVWMDIRHGRLLPFEEARESEDEKHICPLQLDVIERIVTLWSNPGDVVLTPFMGIGSEVYTAVRMGRKGVGVELKESYYRQAVKNVREAASGAANRKELDLFESVHELAP